LTLTDTAAVSTDDTDCTQADGHSVTCPIHKGGDLDIDLSATRNSSFTYGPQSIPPRTQLEVDFGGGTNTVIGSPGNDLLMGGPGNNTLRGGAGNDDLEGNGGSDTLDGGPGNDRINAEDGHGDTLTGGRGSDRFSAGAGDTINAKDGQQTDFIGCERPAKHVSYDAATTLDPDGHPNDQAEVAECLGHDTGSGTMHPSPSRPSFTLTPTTRTLHVRMVCPRSVTFGCSGGQVDFEVLIGPLTVFYTSPSARGGYFILPGKSLNLPLHLTPHRSSADAIKYLRADAHSFFYWGYQPKDPTGQRPDRHLSNLKVRIG
jgi:hypothetical protein